MRLADLTARLREHLGTIGKRYPHADRRTGHVVLDVLRECKPPLNSGAVELLHNQRLTNQLLGLERRTARSGKESIEHGPGRHDDVANAAAGALVLVPRRAMAAASRTVARTYSQEFLRLWNSPLHS
jgi:hypothetical protein